MPIEDDYGNTFSPEEDVSLGDPLGNDIIGGSTTDEPASYAFLRAEWLRGVSNGDFAVPPYDPDRKIVSDINRNDYNPLPGWEVTDGAGHYYNGLHEVWWVPDTSGSGGTLQLRTAAGASDEVFIEQWVANRSSVTRNAAFMPMLSFTGDAAAYSSSHYCTIRYDEYNWDRSALIASQAFDNYQNANISGAYDFIPIYTRNLNAATGWVRLKIGLMTSGTWPAGTIEFNEVWAVATPPFVGFPDLGDPTRAPGMIRSYNGQMTFNPPGGSGGGYFQMRSDPAVDSMGLVSFGGIDSQVADGYTFQVENASLAKFLELSGAAVTLPSGATVHNFAPTDAIKSTLIRYTGGANIDVTGISASAFGADTSALDKYRILFLVNDATSGNITLKQENTGSTNVNRLWGPNGADYICSPRTITMLMYMSTGSRNRWFVVGGAGVGGGGGSTPQTNVFAFFAS